jgi:hypothetical protein
MAKPRPAIYNRNDRHHSPEGAQLLAGLRGDMVGAAEAVPMPTRFSAIPDPDGPRMIVCDEETGRSIKVGLYAYSELRKALDGLFGEGA